MLNTIITHSVVKTIEEEQVNLLKKVMMKMTVVKPAPINARNNIQGCQNE